MLFQYLSPVRFDVNMRVLIIFYILINSCALVRKTVCSLVFVFLKTEIFPWLNEQFICADDSWAISDGSTKAIYGVLQQAQRDLQTISNIATARGIDRKTLHRNRPDMRQLRSMATRCVSRADGDQSQIDVCLLEMKASIDKALDTFKNRIGLWAYICLRVSCSQLFSLVMKNKFESENQLLWSHFFFREAFLMGTMANILSISKVLPFNLKLIKA